MDRKTTVNCIIFGTLANILCGQDGVKFVEDRIRCSGNIIFETKDTDQSFIFYQNSSGVNELDCATKCFQKLQFCNSVRYDSLSRRCLYSYRGSESCANQESNPTKKLFISDKSSVIIYCIRCRGLAEIVAEPPQVRKEENFQNKKFYNRSAYLLSSSKLAEEDRNLERLGQTTVTALLLPVLSNLDTDSKLLGIVQQRQYLNDYDKQSELFTEKSFAITDSGARSDNIDGYKNNYQPYGQQTISTEASVQGYRIKSKLDIKERTAQPQFRHILPVIKLQTDKKLNINLPDINFNSTNLTTIGNFKQKSACNDDLLVPCKHDVGRDCGVTTVQNCQICICPLKSPARGCTGPQGLTAVGRLDLLIGRKLCPDGRTPQPVMRYMRTVDKAKQIDDCVLTIEPYCGYVMDVRFWRMPRTKDECYYYCYSDAELKSRNIDSKNLFALL